MSVSAYVCVCMCVCVCVYGCEVNVHTRVDGGRLCVTAAVLVAAEECVGCMCMGMV